jgi:RND family efflux transporter MFP subunit
MKRSNTLYLFLLPLFLLSCGGNTATETSIPAPGQVIPVSLQDLQATSFSAPIQSSGTFTTKDETLLSFKIGGIVAKVWVQEGDAIKAGQVLASLDLTEIQAGVNQSKLAYEKALRDQQRATKLYQDSVATLEQFENSKTALDIAEQQLKTANFNLSQSQIRAAKNGFVLKKFVNAGQLVASGTPILQINGASSSTWVFQATVSDQQWSILNLEDQAEIFPASGSTAVRGKVIRKSQAADPMTGSYWAEIALESVEGLSLASGMFGKASIQPTTTVQGWEIPFESLLDAEGDSGYVFVTEDGKTAKKVKVKVGKISPNAVQILSGLENYRSLIVSGSAYLSDGSTIEEKGK